MPTSILAAALAALGLLAPLRAAAFTLSQAPVADDPGLTPRGMAQMWPHVGVSEAKRLFHRDGVLFLDGRSQAEWARARIPGAVLLAPADFDNGFPMLKARLIHAKVLVCYCQGYSCEGADYLAQLLTARGLRNVAVFPGGFPAWKRAGYPLEGTDVPKKAHIHKLAAGR